MSILLVSVQDNMEVIGLKQIHYCLLAAGVSSEMLFMPRFDADMTSYSEAVSEFIADRKYKAVGVSLMSTEFLKASSFSRHVKERYPDVTIIWGGIHPTIAPADCLEFADYVCVGEGEEAMIEFARALEAGQPVESIGNLCYIKDGMLVSNPLRPLMHSLSDLPFCEQVPRDSFILDAAVVVPLDEKLFRKYDRYRGTMYNIMSSRGCPFSCTYCCNNFINKLYGHGKIRRRSIDSVLSELEKARAENSGIEYVNFQDDCFLSCSEEYLAEFCEQYLRRVKTPFIIRSIPTYITERKIQLLKKAGMAWASIGLQSGSDRVNRDVYHRRSMKNDFLRAAGIIDRYGIAAMYDVILDNPFETEEDRLETVETLIETPKPFYSQFFSLTFYLGTEIHGMALRDLKVKGDEYLTKPYNIYSRNVINDMTRAAAVLPAGITRKLLGLFRTGRDSAGFRMLYLATRLSMLFYEPVMYLLLVRRSQGGSILRTISVLPGYFREGVRRFLWQFRGNSKDRREVCQ